MKVTRPAPTAETWQHTQPCYDCGATLEIKVADVVAASTPLSGAMFKCPCGKENRVESKAMPEAVWRSVQAACAKKGEAA